MGTYEVRFSRENIAIRAEEGITVLQAQRLAGLHPDAPCGGLGTCGKCMVRITDKTGSAVVRACQTEVHSDMTVETLSREGDHAILAEGLSRPVALKPLVRYGTVTVPKLKLGDNLSDWGRLQKALEESFGESMDDLEPDLALASRLYDMLRESNTWYVAAGCGRVLKMSREPFPALGAAFDLGTTTIVGYLLDLETGRVLAAESAMNPQSQFGADVIMRANYALENGVESLSLCVRDAIQKLLDALAADCGKTSEDILVLTLVGNTCMRHLFLNVSPASLVHAPYNPAISQGLTMRASDCGLTICPGGQIVLLPDIAGFVGADTMGCLLCTRPDQKDQVTLMIDIGTNGEMVLGSKNRLVTCSTAAGPAFEGAKIECGMRGAEGAVDHVRWENGRWHYTTVGGGKAAGLCGSGLIDLVASLLEAGLIDESGHLEDDSGRFVLVPGEETVTGEPVYLSQKDIREVQLAKAAIAAGIQLMMDALGVTHEDISAVQIAGAFGNYMDPAMACRIGLIPRELGDRIVPIGNAAGEGAKIALLNRDELAAAEKLAREVDFVELASSPDFQDCFVDELEFPENDQ